MRKKYRILILVIIAVVGLDQWTKNLAIHYLKRPTKNCSPCSTQLSFCRQRCQKKALPSREFSFLACVQECQQRKKRCQQEYRPFKKLCLDHHQQLVVAWDKRVQKLEGSPFCRKIIRHSNVECVVFEHFFHYKYQTNSGAAWGIFSSYPSSFRRPFFIFITIFALAIILYFFLFKIDEKESLMLYSLALIVGGALGNFWDRLSRDYVVDFIKWFVQSKDFYYEWPTFNIADVAISVGVALVAIALFFFFKFHEDEELDEGGNEEHLS